MLNSMITTVAEGMGNPELDPKLMPSIDLEISRLGDWLLSRELSRARWSQVADVVADKVAQALASLPPAAADDPVVQGLTAPTLTEPRPFMSYWRAKTILAAVKDAESDSRTFYGSYTSDAVAAWDHIVSLYAQDGVHLAAAARKLTNTVRYDLPSCLRALDAHASTLARLAEQEQTDAATVARLCADYDADAERLSLCGLIGSVGPDALATLDPTDVSAEVAALHARASRLPEVLESALGCALYDTAARLDTVRAVLQLDGLAASAGGPALAVLGWFAQFDSPTSNASSAPLPPPFELDAPDDPVARTLLDPAVRAGLVQDLDAAHTFLSQRAEHIRKLANTADTASSVVLNATGLSLSDAAVYDGQARVFATAVEALESELIHDLVLLNCSPRYVTRVATDLHRKLVSAAKTQRALQAYPSRRAELARSRAQTHARIPRLIALINELKSDLESEISDIYKGRTVRITGVRSVILRAHAAIE